MATGNIVVWEWQDEYGRQRPYDPHVSDFIEQEHVKSSSGTKSGAALLGKSLPVSLGTVDPVLNAYCVDFSQMHQMRMDTGVCRSVQRKIYPTDSPLGKGITWSYQGDYHGQWYTYAADIVIILEDTLSKGLAAVNLSQTSLGLPYTIDIKKMVEVRNDTGSRRIIQRNISAFRYTATVSAAPTHTSSGAPGHAASLPGSYYPSIFGSSSAAPAGMHLPQPPASFTSPLSSLFGATSNPVISSTASHPAAAPGLATAGSSTSHSYSLPFSATAAKKKSLSLSADSSVPSKSRRRTRAHKMTAASSGAAANGFIPQPTSGTVFNYSGNADSQGSSATDVLRNYVTVMETSPKDEDCCICCESLTEESGYGDNPGDHQTDASHSVVLRLDKCSHMFHKACLAAMYDSGPKSGSLQCPTCKTIYGVKMGNCPQGRMDYSVMHHSLPGYSDCATIRIVYTIPQGIQGPEHPHPNQSFRTQGFPRTGFLPDNADGRKVLKLLIKAFERRLTFTIGTSVTTGLNDTVVWNEIHHKTEFGSNQSGHGYPDENYISNVLAELAAQGVVEEEAETGGDLTVIN